MSIVKSRSGFTDITNTQGLRNWANEQIELMSGTDKPKRLGERLGKLMSPPGSISMQTINKWRRGGADVRQMSDSIIPALAKLNHRTEEEIIEFLQTPGAKLTKGLAPIPEMKPKNEDPIISTDIQGILDAISKAEIDKSGFLEVMALLWNKINEEVSEESEVQYKYPEPWVQTINEFSSIPKGIDRLALLFLESDLNRSDIDAILRLERPPTPDFISMICLVMKRLGKPAPYPEVELQALFLRLSEEETGIADEPQNHKMNDPAGKQ